jgi:hypothetical protein
LEPEIHVELLGDLANQPLEGKLANQQVGGFLIPPYLTEGYSARSIAAADFTTPAGESVTRMPARKQLTLPGGLGGEVLSWGLAASRLACCLLGTSHIV